MFVSITRLRLRRWWFLPSFAFHTLRIGKQARSSPGFVVGTFAREPGLVFWTITVWADEGSMRTFRNSGPHRDAMPGLLKWCDEASYVHWQQDDASLPTAYVAFERLRDSGKASKVRFPTVAHSAGATTGPAEPELVGEFRPDREASGAKAPVEGSRRVSD